MASTYRDFQRQNLDRLIRSYDGVAGMLDALRTMGYVLGLATSKVEWAARLTFEYYGLGKFLDVLVFHDETRLHKPHPEPLLLAAKKSGIPPKEVVYVGDSVHDMVAGKTAGMLTIGAAWGPFEPAVLRSAGADALAYRPADLVTLLPGPKAWVGKSSDE
jgi:pyrophosphatase PpaX